MNLSLNPLCDTMTFQMNQIVAIESKHLKVYIKDVLHRYPRVPESSDAGTFHSLYD